MELTRMEAAKVLEVIAKAHSFSRSFDYMDHSRKFVERFLDTSRLTRELEELEMLLMHRLKMNHPKEVNVLREEPKVSHIVEELNKEAGSEENAPETGEGKPISQEAREKIVNEDEIF